VVDGAAKGNPNDPKSASNKRIRAITAAVAKRAHEFGPRVGNHTMVASRRGASAPSCSVLHLRNQVSKSERVIRRESCLSAK